MGESDRLFQMRRRVRGNNKKKRFDFTRNKFKYGLEEPRNINRDLEINANRGDTKWCDSMALEVDSIIDIDCFEFRPAVTKPPDKEYQSTQLHCVFNIKHDLIIKSRLVAGGHLIGVPTVIQVHSPQVKPISVKLVGVIADQVGLKQLCGDV